MIVLNEVNEQHYDIQVLVGQATKYQVDNRHKSIICGPLVIYLFKAS